MTATSAGPDGAPVAGARVAVLSAMTAMAGHRDETAAIETEPGRYVARDVPLAMPGTWHLTIRVSPRGEPTTTTRFAVEIE
jgi:hypothetical protein